MSRGSITLIVVAVLALGVVGTVLAMSGSHHPKVHPARTTST